MMEEEMMPTDVDYHFLMMLFSLAETGGHPNLPVITIPAG